MGFTTPCYIKKTNDDIIKALINLGYVEYGIHDFEPSYIFCNNGWCFRQSVPARAVSGTVIDCGENEELFLAIAALNDETNYMKWFICIENYVESSMKVWNSGDWDLNTCTDYFDSLFPHWRKATVEELIEHFK